MPVTQFSANESVTWSLAGGNDVARFRLDAATGQLPFGTAPDHEAPVDADGNNVYELQVRATDAAGQASVQAVLVTVTDLDELAPVISGLAGSAAGAGARLAQPASSRAASVRTGFMRCLLSGSDHGR